MLIGSVLIEKVHKCRMLVRIVRSQSERAVHPLEAIVGNRGNVPAVVLIERGSDLEICVEVAVLNFCSPRVLEPG